MHITSASRLESALIGETKCLLCAAAARTINVAHQYGSELRPHFTTIGNRIMKRFSNTISLIAHAFRSYTISGNLVAQSHCFCCYPCHGSSVILTHCDGCGWTWVSDAQMGSGLGDISLCEGKSRISRCHRHIEFMTSWPSMGMTRRCLSVSASRPILA